MKKSASSSPTRGDSPEHMHCNVEKGVAEINSQLCSAMLTMVLNEEVAREFQHRSQAYFKQSLMVIWTCTSRPCRKLSAVTGQQFNRLTNCVWMYVLYKGTFLNKVHSCPFHCWVLGLPTENHKKFGTIRMCNRKYIMLTLKTKHFGKKSFCSILST